MKGEKMSKFNAKIKSWKLYIFATLAQFYSVKFPFFFVEAGRLQR